MAAKKVKPKAAKTKKKPGAKGKAGPPAVKGGQKVKSTKTTKTRAR